MNHLDVILDFETFGKKPNAAVVQIGACYFDRYTGTIGCVFEKNVDAEDEVKQGFEMDASTVYWWMQQSDEARDSLRRLRADSYYAFFELNTFLSKATAVWSHATFDFVILMNHFDKLGITSNVNYRMARDLRTLVDDAGVNPYDFPRVGTHHNALDDCKFQVQYAVESFRRLRGN